MVQIIRGLFLLLPTSCGVELIQVCNDATGIRQWITIGHGCPALGFDVKRRPAPAH
jgi:hypothetical protein